MPEAATVEETETAKETAQSNAKTVPEWVTVLRNAVESDGTEGSVPFEGNPYTYERAKLKKKKSDDDDKYALVPEKLKDNDEAYDKWLAHLGKKQAALLSYQRARGMSANWTKSAINDLGEFNLDSFVKYVQEMSARGETIKALESERIDLTREIIGMSKNKELTAVEKAKRMDEIGVRLNEIEETIAFRQAKNIEDAELEEGGGDATPAAAVPA